jgi:hypothetical protein
MKPVPQFSSRKRYYEIVAYVNNCDVRAYFNIPVIVIPSPCPLLASFTEKIPLEGTTASATSNST